MNEIINKFLLTGDKFLFELHRQLGITLSACGPFTKHSKRTEKSQRNRKFKTYL